MQGLSSENQLCLHNCQIKALHQLYFKNRGPVDRENSLLTNWWSISKVHNSSQWKLKPTMSEYNWSELVFFNLVICLLNETPWISERYFCWPVLGVQGLIRVKESFSILKISIYLICISCATLLKKKTKNISTIHHGLSNGVVPDHHIHILEK